MAWLRLLLVVTLMSAMVGCATDTALKAPCNWTGSNCGKQTKINEWDNG